MTKDDLSTWASIAEIIAAIAVIVSLVFVGLQLNEGNRETRAATVQAATDSEMFLQSQILRYAEVWEKMISGAPLENGLETRRAINLFNMAMTELENRYLQFEAGYGDAETWDARRNSIEIFVAMPMFKNWRESLSASTHTPRFLKNC
jgi:hypothetical protein